MTLWALAPSARTDYVAQIGTWVPRSPDDLADRNRLGRTRRYTELLASEYSAPSG